MEMQNLQLVVRDNSGYIQKVDVQKVDKSLFGGNGTLTGLNIYQIMPKVKQLVFSGQSGTQNGILGGGYTNFNSGWVTSTTCSVTVGGYEWGISRPKTFYIKAVTGLKTIYYEYIDTLGNERTMSYAIPTLDVWYPLPLQTGFTQEMVGINNFRLSSSMANEQEQLYISGYLSAIASENNSLYSACYNGYRAGVLTCPANAIMFITNITIYAGLTIFAPTTTFGIYKYDAVTGARKSLFYMNINVMQYTITPGHDGTIGGYIYPGEAVVMSTLKAVFTVAHATVVIKYLS